MEDFITAETQSKSLTSPNDCVVMERGRTSLCISCEEEQCWPSNRRRRELNFFYALVAIFPLWVNKSFFNSFPTYSSNLWPMCTYMSNAWPRGSLKSVSKSTVRKREERRDSVTDNLPNRELELPAKFWPSIILDSEGLWDLACILLEFSGLGLSSHIRKACALQTCRTHRSCALFCKSDVVCSCPGNSTK